MECFPYLRIRPACSQMKLVCMCTFGGHWVTNEVQQLHWCMHVVYGDLCQNVSCKSQHRKVAGAHNCHATPLMLSSCSQIRLLSIACCQSVYCKIRWIQFASSLNWNRPQEFPSFVQGPWEMRLLYIMLINERCMYTEKSKPEKVGVVG